MTKVEAWDIVHKFVTDGVNCWERDKTGDEPTVCLAFLTGVVEALAEAINETGGKE